MTDQTVSAPTNVRFLVIAPNWLGDLVMSTPLLTLLDAARSGYGGRLAVAVAVRRRWLPLLSGDPRIDALVPMERTGRHAGLRGLPALASAWRRGRYDAAVICPPSLRVAAAAWLAGIRLRCGYRTDGRHWLLDPSVAPLPRGQAHYSAEMTLLGEVLLARLSGGEHRKAIASPAAVEQAAVTAPALPACSAVAAADPGEGPPLWIVAPGTTYGEAKVWPVDRVAEFVASAVTDAGVRVVLLGDAAATAFVAALRRRLALPWRTVLAGPAGVVDLVGRTELSEAVALLKTATAFVGNDSGLMHLAAALGVPTLGVFGSSSPAWTAPRGPCATALTATGFACQPCFRKRCSEPRFCLDTVSGERVMTRLQKLLADGAAAPPPASNAAAGYREAR